MAAGYTRQAAATISSGLTIASADLNAEFNQAQAAFDITSGHDHSGSAAGTGAKIILTSAVSGILPVANGGTGVTTSTGTGSVVLSASPTLTGTLTAAGISTSGTIYSGNGNIQSDGGAVSQATFFLTRSGVAKGSVYLVAGGNDVVLWSGTDAIVATTLTAALRFPAYGSGALTTDASGNLSSGTLAIAKGGTGTTSTTFCNLATNVTGILSVGNGGTGGTTSTGSGSLVLATSPTLAGTVAAANLTASGTLTGNVLKSSSITAGITYFAGDGTLTSSGGFSSASVGYQRMQGTMIQWGSAVVNGSTAISFGTAFSATAWSIVVTGQAGLFYNVGTPTTVGFTCVPNGAGSTTVNWIAIGQA